MDFSEVGKGSGETKVAIVYQFPVEAKFLQAKMELEPYDAKVKELVRDAETMEVKDEASAREAVSLAAKAKTLDKELAAKEKEIIDSPANFVKRVRNLLKTWHDPLGHVEAVCKKKNADFQWSKELERREKEKKAQVEQRKFQESLNKEAAAKGVEPVTVPELVLPKTNATVRTETGASAHIRTDWKAEITDPGQVPREFCVPSQALLNEAVKMGIREIPGVRIYEAVGTVLRT